MGEGTREEREGKLNAKGETNKQRGKMGWSGQKEKSPIFQISHPVARTASCKAFTVFPLCIFL